MKDQEHPKRSEVPLSTEREEAVSYILQYTVHYEYSSREGWGGGRVEEREGQGKGRGRGEGGARESIHAKRGERQVLLRI